VLSDSSVDGYRFGRKVLLRVIDILFEARRLRMAASEGRIFQNGTKKVVKSSSKWETRRTLLKLYGGLGFFPRLRDIWEVEMLGRPKAAVYPSGSGYVEMTESKSKIS
jgi:hypothetical protein